MLCKVLKIACCKCCTCYAGEVHGLPYPHTPQRLEDMGAAWLTQAMRKSGALHPGEEVAKMEVRPMSHGGLLGDLVKVTCEYRGAKGDCGAPRHLVAKFASQDLKTRITTDIFGLNEAEIAFYATVRGTVVDQLKVVDVPRCPFADWDSTTGNCVLIMEDLSGAAFCEMLAPPGDAKRVSDADIGRAVVALAALHSAWWGGKVPDARLRGAIARCDRPEYAILGPEAEKGWNVVSAGSLPLPPGKGFEKWTFDVPEELKRGDGELARDILAHVYPMLQAVHAPGGWPGEEFPMLLCFAHGDTRIDNWYFRTVGGEQRAGLVDWQLCSLGPAGADLSWFLCCSFPPGEPATRDDAVLDQYLSSLRLPEGHAAPARDALLRSVAVWHAAMTLAKGLVAASGVEYRSGEHALLQARVIDTALRNIFDMFRHWGCAAQWKALRAKWPKGKERKTWAPSPKQPPY